VKKKFKRILTLGAMALATACLGVFTACSEEPTGEKLEQDAINNGWSCTVTYDPNGGQFGNNAELSMLVEPGSYTFEPNDETLEGISMPKLEGFVLAGWYQAQFDDEGNVMYEEDGVTPILQEKAWDFAKDKVTENIVLYAKWRKNYKYTIRFMTENPDGTYNTLTGKDKSIPVDPEDEYKGFMDWLYPEDGEIREDKINGQLISSYTPIAFYMDEAMTKKVDESYENYVHPLDDAQPEVVIYAECLPGKAEFIYADTDFDSLKLKASSCWFLYSDIVFSENMEAWTSLNAFTGCIYGNGHSISGIRIKSSVNAIRLSKSHSIFGTMSGRVENVTFKNVQIEVGKDTDDTIDIFGGTKDQFVSLLAGNITDKGIFKNVVLENCSITAYKVEGKDYPIQKSEADGYYWNAAANGNNADSIAKQSVTGTVTYQEVSLGVQDDED